MNYLFFLSSELVSLSCTIKNPLNVTRHIVTRHVFAIFRQRGISLQNWERNRVKKSAVFERNICRGDEKFVPLHCRMKIVSAAPGQGEKFFSSSKNFFLPRP